MDDRWIQTYTGKRFWPYTPRVEDVCIGDIAHHLAARNRFSGATRWPYSVAEHSVRCSWCVGGGATVRLWALLHDADEAYLPDVPTPLKGPREWLASYRLHRVIAEKFQLPWPIPEAIHEVDRRMLATERRDLMVPMDWGRVGAEPFAELLTLPWAPPAIEEMFLYRFYELQWERGIK